MTRRPNGQLRWPEPSPPLPERDPRGWLYIYHLICPVTHRVRYIGCTCDPAIRRRTHTTGKLKSTRGWIEWLADQGLLPIMVVVAGPLPRRDAYAEELRRIRLAKREGWSGLLNQNNAGMATAIDLTEYATVASAARSIGVPRTTLQQAIKSGHVQTEDMFGGDRVVLLASAREWAERSHQAGRPGRKPAVSG